MSVIKEGQLELLYDIAGSGVTRTPQYLTFKKNKQKKTQDVVLSPTDSEGAGYVSYNGTVLTIVWPSMTMTLSEEYVGHEAWKKFMDAENLWQAYLDMRAMPTGNISDYILIGVDSEDKEIWLSWETYDALHNKYCPHPTAAIRYYSELTAEGEEYEEYCCTACDVWLPPAFTEQYHARPDWVEDIPVED